MVFVSRLTGNKFLRLVLNRKFTTWLQILTSWWLKLLILIWLDQDLIALTMFFCNFVNIWSPTSKSMFSRYELLYLHLFIFLEQGDSFGRSLLYGYELPRPFLPRSWP